MLLFHQYNQFHIGVWLLCCPLGYTKGHTPHLDILKTSQSIVKLLVSVPFIQGTIYMSDETSYLVTNSCCLFFRLWSILLNRIWFFRLRSILLKRIRMLFWNSSLLEKHWNTLHFSPLFSIATISSLENRFLLKILHLHHHCECIKRMCFVVEPSCSYWTLFSILEEPSTTTTMP